MTNPIPSLDLPPDDNQETTPHNAQQTAPMRPVSVPEQSASHTAITQAMTPQATPPRTPTVPQNVTPPPHGTRAMPAVPQSAAQSAPPVPSGTRPMPPVGSRPAVPPARSGGPVPPRRAAPATMYQRRGQPNALTPRDSSLYLPWWSLVLMLVGVLVMAFLIVLAIVLLGGNANPTSRDPIIVIVTAPPTAQGQQPSGGGGQTGGSQVLMGQNPPSALDLLGPTLPPVQFTATPVTIEIGKLVIVAGVDGDELNVRDNPGVQGTNIVSRVAEGTLLTIVDGPRQADGFTWWQVQSADQTLKGWAVSNFLQVASGGV